MPQMQLDDENEPLDWGNDEEEQQDYHRKRYNPEEDVFVGDDVEDTISLGDEEDDQGFCSVSRPNAVNSSPSLNSGPPVSTPSSQTRSRPSGAKLTHQGTSPETQSQGAVQEVITAQEAQKGSAFRSSPPRPLLPRPTHALPPKPVVASATALSSTYMTAATNMTSISPRSSGRDSKKSNGASGKPAPADLPQDWETRSSRKGEIYYYNLLTHECTWTHPSIAQEASKSVLQPQNTSVDGNKQPNSNTSHTQVSRELARNEESEIQERKRPLTPDANGLTFEDRHYRPGVDPSVSEGARRILDRSESTSRYPRSRSPFRRSISPPGLRGRESTTGQRSAPERPRTISAPTHDSYIPEYEARMRNPRSPSPRRPADNTKRNSSSSEVYETRMQIDREYRPAPSRGENMNRHRSRDRDLPPSRNQDVRQPSASQTYYSAQRSRSPAPLLPSLRERREGWDGRREDRERDLRPEAPHQHSTVSAAARSDKEGRHSESERSRLANRSQDYTKGRERTVDADKDTTRRNLDQESFRNEDRLEHNHSARREVDRPSRYSPEPYVSEARLQTEMKSRPPLENLGRRPEEPLSRSKRVPLPPQQASFRSSRSQPLTTSPSRTEDNKRDDSQQSLSVSELERFRDRYENRDRGRDNVDNKFEMARGKHPPQGEVQRSNNSIDPGKRERSPVSRSEIVRKETYDRSKEERLPNREGGDRDVRQHIDKSSSKRGKDSPRQPTRLTGTNNIPIGNRRTLVQSESSTQHLDTSDTGLLRILPPGKESYERPPASDLPRHPGSSRTEAGKIRPYHDGSTLQIRPNDSGSQRPSPHSLSIPEQNSSSLSNRLSTSPLVSRKISSSILPNRSDARPNADSRMSNFTDPPANSREGHRHRDESGRWDSNSKATPDRRSPLSSGIVPLPPRLRKPLGNGADLDAKIVSSGDSRANRSDFISRVEPPPLRRGGSLLDRLSIDDKDRGDSLPLRDRLVPSKRLRDEMLNGGGSPDGAGVEEFVDDDANESRRIRRRGGKRKSTATGRRS